VNPTPNSLFGFSQGSVPARVTPFVKPMKKKIKAPVIQERATYYPRNAVCPWCKKKKVMEPHLMSYP